MIPYTTKSGVKIGIRYERKPPPMTRDEERIQTALLGVSRPRVPRAGVLIAVLLSCYLLASCIHKLQ